MRFGGFYARLYGEERIDKRLTTRIQRDSFRGGEEGERGNHVGEERGVFPGIRAKV